MHIRPATLADIPAIQRVADIAFRHTYAHILSPAQLDYMMDWMYSTESLTHQIADPGKHFLLAEDDAPNAPNAPDVPNVPDASHAPDAPHADASFPIVGYVSFEPEDTLPDGRPLFHLQKLYVLPDYQGHGLGRALFTAVTDALRTTCGHARIELNVNRHNPAVTFYRHLGLTCAREGDFPIGHGYYMNDYIYALDL